MVILTAVVLTVTVGTMVQKSEFIMAAFTSPDEFEAVDDAFSVRAGRTQTLDVLSNDMNVGDSDASNILIVTQPTCGSVERDGGLLEYSRSDSCEGRISFTYCVVQGDSCPAATVTLNVAPASALDSRPIIASSNFPTLRAPSLAAPNESTSIQPSEAVASVRARPDQPTGIVRPDFNPGSGIERQESAAISIGAAASNLRAQPTIEAPSTPMAMLQPAPAPEDAIRQERPDLAASAPQAPLVASTSGLRPQGVDSRPTIGGSGGAPALAGNGGAPSGLSGALVTERAAQVIVPPSAASGSAAVAAAPTLPGAPAIPSLGDAAPQRGDQSGAAPAPAPAEGVAVAALSEDASGLPAPDFTGPLDCDVNMIVTPRLGEILSLTLNSDCRAGRIATVEHAGILFDVALDASGSAMVEFPALVERSDITVRFEDGAVLEETVTITGIENSSRVAIAWAGDVDLDLHAFEFGASETNDGHVWSSTPRSYRESRRSGGGFLTVLGIPGGNQAEIYTLPVTRRTQEGVVDIVVRVSEETSVCEERLEVTAVQNDRELTADERQIFVGVESCDGGIARQEFTTAVRDITVARR